MKEPDLIEKTALAQILHSFYNGIENIFMQIAKYIDKKIPQNSNWHKELLDQMTKQTEQRKAVITIETKELLLEYLGFRHVVRHSYSTNLELNRVKNLGQNINKVWGKFKMDINNFI